MHIRKVRGPRTVQLPDGGFLSRGDLPPPHNKTLGRIAQGDCRESRAVWADFIGGGL